MSAAVPLLLFGLVLLAIGAVILTYPGAMPDSVAVSPNAINSDPAAAAAKARRWNRIRGFVTAAVGLGFLVAGLASLT
ncbi:hypothetical protein [Haloarcula sediminis]|uniref:hypothetical protein n=1 Tax=Haloarcula sediminis TaxID=3111777 RepID=UPI002D78888E|nr:hypothetical protein [Haloarcula sp. CK38]